MPHSKPNSKPQSKSTQPLWLRLMHWINAFAVIVMTLSGWRIYNGTQFLHFHIPSHLTIGGWLAGALQWHFAAMWLLVINGLAYLIVNIVTKRLWTQFFPLSPRLIFDDLLATFKGRLSHDEVGHFNAVQKIAYLFVMVDIIVLVMSGLVLWKSVQFPILRTLMGGYEASRYIHFYAMTGLVAFFIVHIVMALLVPKTIKAMITGV